MKNVGENRLTKKNPNRSYELNVWKKSKKCLLLWHMNCKQQAEMRKTKIHSDFYVNNLNSGCNMTWMFQRQQKKFYEQKKWTDKTVGCLVEKSHKKTKKTHSHRERQREKQHQRCQCKRECTPHICIQKLHDKNRMNLQKKKKKNWQKLWKKIATIKRKSAFIRLYAHICIQSQT